MPLCLFALVKLPLKTVISPFTAAVGVIKGKLVGVPDPRGTQGTREVPLDLYLQLCDYLSCHAQGF